jgi:hypothetical protein
MQSGKMHEIVKTEMQPAHLTIYNGTSPWKKVVYRDIMST